jgi:hypothetical protein
MNLLKEAPSIVSKAISRGLISYPHGTEFTIDGRPKPKLDEVRYKKTPLEQYACLRAWEMSCRGIPRKDIAVAIRCPLARLDAVLAHGKEIHKRRNAK